jgi:hypothetical protein
MMQLTKELELAIQLGTGPSRRLPRFDSFARRQKITPEQAQSVLRQYAAKVGKRVRGEVAEPQEETEKEEMPKRRWPTIEALVIRFSSTLQYFGFIIATLVDIGLAWFFFSSLGSGDTAKVVLGFMGLVLTISKTWGWAYCKIDRKALWVAIVAVTFSIFGNTAILRAEIELQAKTALSTNSAQTSKQSPLDVLQKQIKAKQDELTKKETARDSIDLTVEANLPMYNTLDNKVKLANKELTELNGQLGTVQKEVPVAVVSEVKKEDIQLDAWSVFRQWTELDWSDKPRTLAYFFTLFFACLPELVIFATTPRKLVVRREDE